MITVEHRVIGECHPVFVTGTANPISTAALYAAGVLAPNYPVPTTIRCIKGHGLADGLFDRQPYTGEMVWGWYDNPMPDGVQAAVHGQDGDQIPREYITDL